MDIKKCEFYIEEILYLRIIIGRYNIKIDSIKVIIIKEQAKPENINDI